MLKDPPAKGYSRVPRWQHAILLLSTSFICSLLFALFYRYPVPFYDYIGPFSTVGQLPFIETLNAATSAFFFYGLLGGFIVIAVLHFAINALLAKSSKVTITKLTNIAIATFVSFIWSLFLARLDYIIGPW